MVDFKTLNKNALWSRISKLVGMLGSEHDGEALNAARLLKQYLDREKLTFAELAQRIESGGSGEARTIIVEKRRSENPAEKIAKEILERAGGKLGRIERRFLEDIVASCEMTGGYYNLSPKQANWLSVLQEKWRDHVPTPKWRARKAGPVPDAILDELGLNDPAPKPASDDVDEAVGNFRAAASGERKTKRPRPNQQTVPGAPDGPYKGDFLDGADLTQGDVDLPWET